MLTNTVSAKDSLVHAACSSIVWWWLWSLLWSGRFDLCRDCKSNIDPSRTGFTDRLDACLAVEAHIRSGASNAAKEQSEMPQKPFSFDGDCPLLPHKARLRDFRSVPDSSCPPVNFRCLLQRVTQVPHSLPNSRATETNSIRATRIREKYHPGSLNLSLVRKSLSPLRGL